MPIDYDINIDGQHFGNTASGSPRVVNWNLDESMREAGILDVVLEHKPTGYGIVEGDLVTLQEKTPLVITWKGQVRLVEPTPDGDLHIVAMDKLAHFNKSTYDNIFSGLQEIFSEKTGISHASGFPKLPLAGGVLLPLRHARVVMDPAQTDAVEREPTEWPTYDAYLEAKQDGATHTGDGFVLNFTPQSGEQLLQLQWVMSWINLTAPLYTLTMNYHIVRIDSIDKDALADPSNPHIQSGTVSLPHNGEVYDWRSINVEKFLDPGQLYALILEMPAVTDDFRIRLPYINTTYDSNELASDLIQPSGVHVHYLDRVPFMKFLHSIEIQEIFQGQEYTIDGNDIVFDMDYQPVPDKAGGYPAVVYDALRNDVSLSSIYLALFNSSGLDFTDSGVVVGINTAPTFDFTGATARELLNLLLDQYDYQTYLDQTSGEPRIQALPSGITLFADMGESGIEARAMIITHDIKKDVIGHVSEHRVQGASLSGDPMAYLLENSLQTSLDFGTPGTKLPGFHSVGEITRAGPTTMADLGALAALGEKRRSIDSWRGSIEIDAVVPTLLKPGILAEIRDDSIGLNNVLRVESVSHNWETTTLTLTSPLNTLGLTIRNLDQRLNNVSRLSILSSFDRDVYVNVKDDILIGDAEWLTETTSVFNRGVWARVETLAGYPVTKWVKVSDVADLDPGVVRLCSFYFPQSIETGQHFTNSLGEDVEQIKLRFTGIATPPADQIIPIPLLGYRKFPGTGFVIGIELDKAW